MARAHYDVAGKVVLVTGAARGIGWEAARRLHARGAHVALVGLEPELLARRAQELGERAAAFPADVTDTAALGAAVDAVVARFGGIDVCVANAGVAAVGTVATIDPGDFERVVEVNLLGVWRTLRATLPHVVARRGYVLTISSLAAVVHAPLMGPYTAAKAGVEALSDALRQEVAPTGTRVGVAYFGFIDTDMVRDNAGAPAARAASRRAPGGLLAPLPVARAGDAIEHAVARRARVTYAPRWVGAALVLRGVLQPVFERVGARDAAAAVRRAEADAAAPGGAREGRVPDRGR